MLEVKQTGIGKAVVHCTVKLYKNHIGHHAASMYKTAVFISKLYVQLATYEQAKNF